MISRNINNNNYISQHGNLMRDKNYKVFMSYWIFQTYSIVKTFGVSKILFFTEMNTFIFSKDTLDCSKDSKVIKMFLNQQIIK